MTAHNDLGNINLLFGNQQEDATQHALTHFSLAKQIADALMADDPDSLDARRDVSIACEYIGDTEFELGNWEQAETDYRDSLVVIQGYADNHQYQRDVIVSLAILAIIDRADVLSIPIVVNQRSFFLDDGNRPVLAGELRSDDLIASAVVLDLESECLRIAVSHFSNGSEHNTACFDLVFDGSIDLQQVRTFRQLNHKLNVSIGLIANIGNFYCIRCRGTDFDRAIVLPDLESQLGQTRNGDLRFGLSGNVQIARRVDSNDLRAKLNRQYGDGERCGLTAVQLGKAKTDRMRLRIVACLRDVHRNKLQSNRQVNHKVQIARDRCSAIGDDDLIVRLTFEVTKTRAGNGRSQLRSANVDSDRPFRLNAIIVDGAKYALRLSRLNGGDVERQWSRFVRTQIAHESFQLRFTAFVAKLSWDVGFQSHSSRDARASILYGHANLLGLANDDGSHRFDFQDQLGQRCYRANGSLGCKMNRRHATDFAFDFRNDLQMDRSFVSGSHFSKIPSQNAFGRWRDSRTGLRKSCAARNAIHNRHVVGWRVACVANGDNERRFFAYLDFLRRLLLDLQDRILRTIQITAPRLIADQLRASACAGE